MKFRTIIIFPLFYLSVWCILTPIIEIEQGRLRGLRSVSGQNRYYGIPYARSKRFQPPKPPLQWNGVFNAVNPFGSCAQTVSFITTGSEDCLHLDVFSPEHATNKSKLPVLVFIHGGAYYYGSKWHYDPEFLVTKNIVAVIINFRVGIFGFLCLNGTANLGLKDQVAALKWIRKNIAVFGGDPDNVTISGQSAGASAAAMHLLSKSSAGLFHKLILLSGTPLAPWAFNLEPLTPLIQDARKIRRVKPENILNLLLTSTVTEIQNSTKDTSINPKYFKYSPCIDTNFSEPFFHDTPYKTISSGNFNKVPIISGFASVEGMLFYGLHDDKTLKEWDDNFAEKLPSVFSWCSANKMAIAEELRAYYLADTDGRVTRASMRGIVNFYSDWMAYATAESFANIMSRYSDKPIYNYIFAYEGDRNFAKTIFGSQMKGSSHSDDIFYIFKPAGFSLILSKSDRLFVDRLTTMLTNFMKFGNPTPIKTSLLPTTWPPVTTNHSISMVLDKTLSVVETPSTHKGLFFKKLLCQYGQDGYVPCESEMRCNNLR